MHHSYTTHTVSLEGGEGEGEGGGGGEGTGERARWVGERGVLVAWGGGGGEGGAARVAAPDDGEALLICQVVVMPSVGGGWWGGGGGGGYQAHSQAFRRGHLTREAACCELERVVHCSTIVLSHYSLGLMRLMLSN